MLAYINYEIKEKIFLAQPEKIGSPTGMEAGGAPGRFCPQIGDN
jgi:hypothetical protein